MKTVDYASEYFWEKGDVPESRKTVEEKYLQFSGKTTPGAR
jgi:hypothetical protein